MRRGRPPHPDQLELDLAGVAQTSPDAGPVISQDCRPIADARPTAQIIQFPENAGKLSKVAAAILRDMRRRAAASADGMACHSIKDGMTCSGGARHKVIKARRELQDRGFVTLIRAGSEQGPAIWRIGRARQTAI